MDTIKEIKQLLQLLPHSIRDKVIKLSREEGFELTKLIEIEMDLQRPPVAHYAASDNHRGMSVDLENRLVTKQDIDSLCGAMGDPAEDNRTGIDNTLHRISIIPNRNGEPVGLTIRIGKHVNDAGWGTDDLLEGNKNILVIGPPGVGKTTILRSSALYLSSELNRRTIVVDASDEICGFGDVPHACIGRARKMSVPYGRSQYEMMLQAVENHTPDCLIIDEIGDEKEVQAVRSIAKRGVQLIGTVHGRDLTFVMDNPALSGLLGSIRTVTLSDEMANAKKSSKSVPERQYEPSFDIAVEIIDHTTVNVIYDLKNTIDEMLNDKVLFPETRVKEGDGFRITQKQRLVPDNGKKR